MADWPEHKLVCKSLKQSRVEAMAQHQAQGGLQKDFNSSQRDFAERFLEVPGLRNETKPYCWGLGWKHRHVSPLIHATNSQDHVDGSGIRVKVTPRSDWDGDTLYPLREGLREMYGYSTFCPEKNYVCVFTEQCPDFGPGTGADTVWTLRRRAPQRQGGYHPRPEHHELQPMGGSSRRRGDHQCEGSEPRAHPSRGLQA